jgi:hypothetical protein
MALKPHNSNQIITELLLYTLENKTHSRKLNKYLQLNAETGFSTDHL